jgi:hypothetical protein
MTNQCSTCIFGQTVPTDSQLPPGSLSCNRNAPDATTASAPLFYPWPIVQADFWCGQGVSLTGVSFAPAINAVGVYQSWTPTIGSSTGTITTSTLISARYAQLGSGPGSFINFNMFFTITTNGSGAGAVTINLPTIPAHPMIFLGEASVTGGVVPIMALTQNSGNVPYTATLLIGKSSDDSYPATDNSSFWLEGTYESQS